MSVVIANAICVMKCKSIARMQVNRYSLISSHDLGSPVCSMALAAHDPSSSRQRHRPFVSSPTVNACPLGRLLDRQTALVCSGTSHEASASFRAFRRPLQLLACFGVHSPTAMSQIIGSVDIIEGLLVWRHFPLHPISHSCPVQPDWRKQSRCFESRPHLVAFGCSQCFRQRRCSILPCPQIRRNASDDLTD